MGKRDDHSRVAIWTECQQMDTLLTEVPHFQYAKGMQNAILFLLRTGSSLAFAATNRCLQSGNHDLRGSPWFVAARVLTAEIVMGRLRSQGSRFSDQRL